MLLSRTVFCLVKVESCQVLTSPVECPALPLHSLSVVGCLWSICPRAQPSGLYCLLWKLLLATPTGTAHPLAQVKSATEFQFCFFPIFSSSVNAFSGWRTQTAWVRSLNKYYLFWLAFCLWILLCWHRDRNNVSNGAQIYKHKTQFLVRRTQLFLIKFILDWMIWTAFHIHYIFILLLRDNTDSFYFFWGISREISEINMIVMHEK